MKALPAYDQNIRDKKAKMGKNEKINKKKDEKKGKSNFLQKCGRGSSMFPPYTTHYLPESRPQDDASLSLIIIIFYSRLI